MKLSDDELREFYKSLMDKDGRIRFKIKDNKRRKIMSDNNGKRDLAVGITAGIVGGLIAGGVLGILFAPQSGKETRAEIMDRAEDLVKKVRALPADVRARFNKATLDDVKKK